jgi:hypothetical protein
MRMPLSLCRAQENVLAAWWGEHFSAQSSHELRSYLSLTSEKQRFVLPEPGMLEAHHGAPVDVSWRWHGITVPSHQGVKSKGKKLLKMQNATGLYWADFMQIRSDAFQFQSNVGDESCINLRVLRCSCRGHLHISRQRGVLSLNFKTMNRYDKSLQEFAGIQGCVKTCCRSWLCCECFNFCQSHCFCY